MQELDREAGRSAGEVFESHLEHRQSGDLEGDLQLNYAPDVVMLTMEGVFHGRDGVRENARRLAFYFPKTRFAFPVKWVSDRFAFLEWRAERDGAKTVDGSDTFVIENGLIVCQSVRYTVTEGEQAPSEAERQEEEARPDLAPQAGDEVRVVRLGSDGAARFLVEFQGEDGERVSVECTPDESLSGADERSRAIAAARRIAGRIMAEDREAARRSRTSGEMQEPPQGADPLAGP